MDDLRTGQTAGIRAEFFDFRQRTLGEARLDDVAKHMAEGRFVWLDVDTARSSTVALRSVLPADVVAGTGIDRIEFATDSVTATVSSLRRTDRFLQIVLVGCQPPDDERAEIFEALVCEGFLITAHCGPNALLDRVRSGHLHDFEHHASTPSFLLYEICGHQVELLLSTQGVIEEAVEATRQGLRASIDEKALASLARVNDRLLGLRKRVLSTRRVYEELVARKTHLVSDATLGFIGGMVETLERLLTDIASDREILDTALQHSLTVVSHRTNQTMNRLAVVSTIFLPLSFLCGVYGMNFAIMPEITWDHGYIYFWILSATITMTLVMVLRRARLL